MRHTVQSVSVPAEQRKRKMWICCLQIFKNCLQDKKIEADGRKAICQTEKTFYSLQQAEQSHPKNQTTD